MSNGTIARRYAGALADVVLKTNETETVRGELRVWEQMIADNSELEYVFSNPAIQHADKHDVLESLHGYEAMRGDHGLGVSSIEVAMLTVDDPIGMVKEIGGTVLSRIR